MKTSLRPRLCFPITALCALLVFPWLVSAAPLSGLSSNQNFCLAAPAEWPHGLPSDVPAWSSYCGPVPADRISTAVSESFPAPHILSLYLSGFIDQRRAHLSLVNGSTGERLAIEPMPPPFGGWRLEDFRIPASWQTHRVRLEADGTGRDTDGWVGFSEPVKRPHPVLANSLKFFFRTLEHFALLSLLFFATCLLALRFRISDPRLLTLFGFAGLAVAAYLAFWLWFYSPHLGHLYSFLVHVLAAAFLSIGLWRLTPTQRASLRHTVAPWLLTPLVAQVIISAALLYGGFDDPLRHSSTRFSHRLPADNVIPYVFAEGLRFGQVQRPLLEDWLSSDRPPLQTGFTVLSYPFVIKPRDHAYFVLAVLLQSLWAPALWTLLSAFSLPRRVNAWVSAAALSTGFVLVNNLFVWPKLFAAAYLLVGSSALLSPVLFPILLKRKSLAFLVGSLLCFACLAHGGSAFALLGLLPVVAFLHRRHLKSLLWVRIAAAILLTYLPWLLYQKLYEPPGDKLLKLHLAGVTHSDPRPFGIVLVAAYHAQSWPAIWHARWSNLLRVFTGEGAWFAGWTAFPLKAAHDLFHFTSTASASAASIRSTAFFGFLPSLDLFLFAFLFLAAGALARSRTPLWRVASLFALYVLVTLLIWCALMFTPSGAVVHQGTYITGLLGIALSILAVWNVSPSLAKVLIVTQAILNFAIYVIYSPAVMGAGKLSQGVLAYPEVFLLFFSLLFLIALLRRLAQSSEPDL